MKQITRPGNGGPPCIRNHKLHVYGLANFLSGSRSLSS
jgi:hypothetical protein